MAARRDIRAVAKALLEVTGPLSRADLGGLLGQRFNAATAVHHLSLSELLDGEEGDEGAQQLGPTIDSGEDAVDDAVVAQGILDQLTPEEIRYLALVADGQPVRERAAHLGATKHRESVMWDRATMTLDRLASHGGPELVRRVLELAGQATDLGRSEGGTGGDHV